MSIKWSSVDVIEPLMDEKIIVKNKSTVKLMVLDSRHGIDFWIEFLIENGYKTWSDTNG